MLSKWVTHTTVCTPEIHRLCSKLLITLMADDWSYQTKLLSYIVMNRLPQLLEVEAVLSIRPVTMTGLYLTLITCALQFDTRTYCRISQHMLLINCRIYYIKIICIIVSNKLLSCFGWISPLAQTACLNIHSSLSCLIITISLKHPQRYANLILL